MNVSKPVFISAIFLGLLSGVMVAQVFNAEATDGSGSPFASVWEAIHDAEDRVTSLEEELNQKKTIRFYEPKESFENQSVWRDAATFTWIPENTSNSAIVSVTFYLEYRVEGISGSILYIPHEWGLRIDTPQSYFPTEGRMWHGGLNNEEYRWSGVFQFQQSPTGLPWVLPNQAYYSVAFRFRRYPGYEGTVFVRSINIILTVIDGLSESGQN